MNAGAGIAGDKFNRMAIAQPGPGNQRIFNVGVDTVGFIENRGNTPLGIKCRAFADRPFAQDNNLMFFSQAQRQ